MKKVSVRIRYNVVKKICGVKYLKDCDKIVKDRMNDLENTVATNVRGYCFWDEDGKHRIGITVFLTINNDSDIIAVNNAFDFADEIRIL